MSQAIILLNMMSVIFGSNSLDRSSVVPLGLAKEEGGVPFPAMNRWAIPFRLSGTVL